MEPIKLNNQLLTQWETVVKEHARLRGARDRNFFTALIRQETPQLQQLWELFTQDRKGLGRYLSHPKQELIAYLLGFHLANVARAQFVLERCEQRWGMLSALKACPALEVIDIGCGTGALSSAVSALLSRAPTSVSFQLIDRHKHFLAAAEKMIVPGANKQTQVRAFKQSVWDALRMIKPAQAPRLYLLGYVINELASSPAQVQKLRQHLVAQREQPTMIVILEPANQGPSRAQMELRDDMLESGYRVAYPCPGSIASCPLLDKPRDWCFSDAHWDQPPLQNKVDQAMGVNRQKLATTAFVYASPSFPVNLEPRLPPVVVGMPTLKSQDGSRPPGKDRRYELLLCDGEDVFKERPKAKQTYNRGRMA